MRQKFRRYGIPALIVLVIVLMITLAVRSANTVKTKSFDIRIIHTNDIHARVIENESSGIIGIEKLGSLIQNGSDQYDLNLALDSGDLFHGQPIATLVYGESIAQLIKACGYDAMTAGNHDWSYGKQDLLSLVQQAGLKMLTGNVIVNETGEQFFPDEFLIRSVTKDDITLQVGIFGVIDPQIYTGTSPENVEGLTYSDQIAYAKDAVKRLKEQGCQIIIGLAHCTHPETLAGSVDGVSLWLAGHEHISESRFLKTPDGSDTLVIENSCYLKEIGEIHISCTVDGKGTIDDFKITDNALKYEDTRDIPPSENVTKTLNRINDEVNVILKYKVGSSPADLNGKWEDLRIGETNLGVAAAEAYLLASGADIAFENAGGIRSSIQKGDVTFGDILAVSPYGNYLVQKSLTGAEIREVLELSLEYQRLCIEANESGKYDAWPLSSGSVLQCAGITAEYSYEYPEGERIRTILINGEPLEDQKLYKVVTNNFTAWDPNYPALAGAADTGSFCSCEEALIQFFSLSESEIIERVSKQNMINTDDLKQE